MARFIRLPPRSRLAILTVGCLMILVSSCKKSEDKSELTAARVCKEFDKDERAASEQYKGKVLKLTGQVVRAEFSVHGTRDVYLQGEKPGQSVACHFQDKRQQRTVVGLRKGQAVTVSGRCDVLISGRAPGQFHVIFRECQLLQPEAKETPLPAEDAVKVQGKSVREWVQLLEAGELEPRRQAAWALAALKSKDKALIPFLHVALSDENVVKTAALAALRSMAPELKEAIPPLFEMLMYPGVNEALARYGKEVVPLLMEALPDPSDKERYESGTGRYAGAVETLGLIGSEAKEAVPALVSILEDEKAPEPFRMETARAIGQIGPEAKDALPALTAALQKQGLKPSGPGMSSLRLDLAAAIHRINPTDESALQSLRACLTDGDPHVKVRAAYWLARRDPTDLEALRRLGKLNRETNYDLERDGRQEEECRKWLYDAVTKMHAVVKKGPEKDRRTAALTMVDLHARLAATLFIQNLQNENASVRLAQLEGLLQVGYDANPALPAVQKMAKEDPDPEVRKVANRLLLKIMGKEPPE